MFSPARWRPRTTEGVRMKPSLPTKRRKYCPVSPPNRAPRSASTSRSPTRSVGGHSARKRPKVLCSVAMSVMNCAFVRTDAIFWPFRTIRGSDASAFQNLVFWLSNWDGANPRNASSNPAHFFAITVQANPEQKTRLVISLRKRSAPSRVSRSAGGTSGNSRSKAFSPPFRSAARFRIRSKDHMTGQAPFARGRGDRNSTVAAVRADSGGILGLAHKPLFQKGLVLRGVELRDPTEPHLLGFNERLLCQEFVQLFQ